MRSTAARRPGRVLEMLPDHFGPDVADAYDDPDDPANDPDLIARTVAVLADLAGPGGRALELATGTGRIALPLAGRGVDVSGVELSAAMLEVLRAKPGGAALTVVPGDMADPGVVAGAGDGFDLVYLVFNTIGNLTTQDAQVACFENAAAALRSGGVFCVETTVPGVLHADGGFRVFAHTDAHHGIDDYDADPVSQRFSSHHYTRTPDGTYRRTSVPFRYTWPAELDLMARLAGLRLRDRWQDWDRAPFTASSSSHVSVWQKAG